MRLTRSLTAGAILLLFAGAGAEATHETHHRFTIWGEVLYDDGAPVPGEKIRLTVKGGEVMATLTTNEQGRFREVLHVHDEDVNKVFDMTVREVSKKVTLEFDPGDHKTERGKRIDFRIKR